MLKRSAVALALALLVAPVLAAEDVTLLSPQSINIVLEGGKGKVRVFYNSSKPAVQVGVTNAEPLVSGVDVTAVPAPPQGVASVVDIVVNAKTPPPPGSTLAGIVIFSDGNAVLKTWPYTVTSPAAAFTVEPAQTDICLLCGEPHELTLKVKNSGSTTIDTLALAPVTLSDASRHRTWAMRAKKQLAAQQGKPQDPPKAEPVEAETIKVDLKPGQTKTVGIPLDVPRHAGDYAGMLDFSAGPTHQQAAVMIRTRGPNYRPWLPGVLFTILVIVGATIAYTLEYWFGSGGGDRHAKALIALQQLLSHLNGVKAWIASWDKVHPNEKLSTTAARVEEDIELLKNILANDQSIEELERQQGLYAMILAKRRMLQTFVHVALETAKLNRVPQLDAADDQGDVETYKSRLDGIMKAPAVPADALTGLAASAADRETTDESLLQRLQRQRRFMMWVRWITLGVVTLASAYLMLYYNKCSYGTISDYIATFFWALGLTATGAALVTAGKPKAATP